MRSRALCYLSGGLLALFALASWAVDTEQPFEDAALQARYQVLITEIRCLVCQNQSIADSNATLAADLRREVRKMLADGASDADVYEFLVARYGDFVLYTPPLKPRTWILWGAPFLLLLIGAVIGVVIVRGRARLPIDDKDPESSGSEWGLP